MTCPLEDWVALLATSAAMQGSNSSATGLAPCATATVSSGQDLLLALERLQPGAARVLITLAANISLPANATPQRADPDAGDDDAVPLVVVYRNVTLVGGLHGRTELDVRGRRNAFGLQAGWRLLQQQGAQQLQAASAGSLWRGRPVRVLADLTIANSPPGPEGSWPVGLVTILEHFYTDINRSGTAGLQMLGLRTTVVCTRGEHEYVTYWLNRMTALSAEVRASAAWALRITDRPQAITDADGNTAYYNRLGDYSLTFNFTVSPVGLRTQSSAGDFDLWSSPPTGLLTGAVNHVIATSAAAPPLPADNFATARNASQLLGLLQEAWSGGPRIIFLLRNITLAAAMWPQDGARLSYNVTLAGPVSGAPVQLDTAGLPLIRPAAGGSSNDSAVSGTASSSVSGGSGSDSPVVVLQLQRLVVRGLASRLMLRADRNDVVAASGELGGSAELRDWRDRCLAASAYGAGSSNATGAVRWEARNSTMLLPEGSLQLLRHYNNATACQLNAYGSTDAASAAAALCAALLSPFAASLAGLLRRALTVEGQVAWDAASGTGANTSITFAFATLGGLTLADSHATEAASLALNASATMSEGQNGLIVDARLACGIDALLLAFPALASPASSSSRRPRTAAVAGGSVAGALVATLCVAAAALLLIQKRRKAQARLPKATEPPQCDSTAGLAPAVLVGLGASASGNGCAQDSEHPPGTNTSADVTMSADDIKFSLSSLHADPWKRGATATMAESVFLGDRAPQNAPTGPGRPATALPAQLLRAPAAGSPGPRPHRRSLDKASSPLARLRSQDVNGDSTSNGDSMPSSGPRSVLRTAVADEIETMIRRCQALAMEAPASSQARGRRLRLLGRGAQGNVYLGDWRGLPAAIKVMVVTADVSATRRERLVREVALTMTLEHPHVVPTYHFEIGAVRPDDSAPLDRALTAEQTAGGASDADDGDVAALRLKLVMQYCEGGTLKSALAAGRFSAPLPLASARHPVPDATAAPVTRSQDASASSGTGTSQPSEPSDAAAVRPEQATGPIGSTPTLSRQGSAALGRAASPPLLGHRLEWAGVRAASNLPLSILAALDILRGLEYLHGRGVVHGDLTENNVLLKAAQPTLPQPHVPPRQVQSALRPRIVHTHSGAEPASNGGAAAAAGPAKIIRFITPFVRQDAQLDLTRPSPPRDPAQTVPICAVQPPPPPSRLEGEEERQTREPHLQQDGLVPCSNSTRGSGCGGPSAEQNAHVHASGSTNVEVSLALHDGLEGPGLAQDLSMLPVSPSPAPARMTGEVAVATLPRLPSRLGRCASTNARGDGNKSVTEDGGAAAPLPTHGSLGKPSSPSGVDWPPLVRLKAPFPDDNRAVMEAAAQILGYVFKIADFGLSVQLQGASETHVSNMAQGTPFFAAPEVMQVGRLSPAADIYSFGVLLWLLLHGLSIGQLRHLLPRIAYAPIAPLLLQHASRGLPPAAHYLLARCLAIEPGQRPQAAGLRQMLEDLLRDVAGPRLAWALLSAERRELVVAPVRQ